jgi:helicase MOV-10
MKFHQSFGSISPSAKFTVRFKLNRYPLRRQHQALDTAFAPDRLLFPPDAYVQGRQAPAVGSLRLRVFNDLLNTNPAQLQAVTSIISLPKGALPFALFGP